MDLSKEHFILAQLAVQKAVRRIDLPLNEHNMFLFLWSLEVFGKHRLAQTCHMNLSGSTPSEEKEKYYETQKVSKSDKTIEKNMKNNSE